MSAPPNPEDKRAAPRLLVMGTCELLLVGDRPPRPLSAPLINVSRGGVCVACDPPLPVGTLVRLKTLAARGRTWMLGTEARVVWARHKDPSVPGEPAAVGLSFLSASVATQAALDQLVKALK